MSDVDLKSFEMGEEVGVVVLLISTSFVFVLFPFEIAVGEHSQESVVGFGGFTVVTNNAGGESWVM